VFSIFFSRKSYHLSDKVETYCRPVQATDGRTYGACALHVGYLRTHTHTQYVILIALPLQQWLHERASILHLYVHCLACYFISTETLSVIENNFMLQKVYSLLCSEMYSKLAFAKNKPYYKIPSNSRRKLTN
jgi:hypothetical protein